MRTFWMIIGVLVLATAGVIAYNRLGGTGRVETPAAAAPAPQPVPEPPHASQATSHAPHTQQSPVVSPPSMAEKTTESPAGTATSPPTGSGHNAYHRAGASDIASASIPTPPSKTVATPAPTPVEPVITPGSGSGPGDTQPKDESSGTPAPAGNANAGAFTVGPPTQVEHEDDGWTRLDGRFLVKGEGTPEDPMIVPWELLVSASETYRPRTGSKEMPRRVADLKGKHVKITGYVLFPLMMTETTELLLMRNQWDGCCIGVPPTPYDAVEVKLKAPADRRESFISYVSVEGVLDVDPYVNRDFLLGLFTMDKAELVQPAKDKDKGL